MTINTFLQSKLFKGILIGIAVMVVLLLTFSAGMRVGFRKASFAFRGGENYYKAFEGRGPQRGFSEGRKLPNPNGAVGKVVSVTLPTIIVADKDNTEKVIRITDTTSVRHYRDTVTANDISVGGYIVVIGEPNDSSEVVASLIRILPPPPVSSSLQ